MALTKIRGDQQILPGTITNTEISNTADIQTSKLADDQKFIFNDGSRSFISTVAGINPAQPSHLATKEYVDSVAQSLDVKLSVKVATTDDITLFGVQVIDDVVLNIGDRVLVKNQNIQKDNGIYVVNSGGWERAQDADSSIKVTSGIFTFVEQGTVNANSGWVLITQNPIINVSDLMFTQFSGAGSFVSGRGLIRTGNKIDIVSENGGIKINEDSIALTTAGSTLTITPDGIKLSDLTQGHILIGNPLNVAEARIINGDITIDYLGTSEISPNVITDTEISNTADIQTSKLADDQKFIFNDGSRIFTAPISGVNPVNPEHLATKSYVDGFHVSSEVTTVNDYTITPTDYIVFFNGTNLIATLSLVSTFKIDQKIIIKNISNSNLTIIATAPDTIDGGSQFILYPGELLHLTAMSDWLII